MFDINKKSTEPIGPSVDGAKNLRCPDSTFPHSLMDEYQKMMSESRHHQLKLKSSDTISDGYSIDRSDGSLNFVAVKPGGNPAIINDVQSLANATQQDFFQNGQRDGVQFRSPKAPPEAPILVDAKIVSEGGTERVTSETGYIASVNGLNVRSTGIFEATFDLQGKLSTLVAGPNRQAMTDAMATCEKSP